MEEISCIFLGVMELFSSSLISLFVLLTSYSELPSRKDTVDLSTKLLITMNISPKSGKTPIPKFRIFWNNVFITKLKVLNLHLILELLLSINKPLIFKKL